MTTGVILKPYDNQRRMPLGWRMLLGILLVLVSAFYGLMAAVLPMQLITIPLGPILLVAILCLWLMPDIGGLHDAFFEKTMIWVIGLQVLWPYYIALNFPGFPYIGPMRIVVGAMVFSFAFNLATSAEMRRQCWEAMQTVPLINKLFWGFWALNTVTLIWAMNRAAAFSKYMNNQVFWTIFYIVALLAARRPGMVRRGVVVLVAASIPVALLGIVEFRFQKVFWAEYIPDFLMARGELGEKLLGSTARATTPDNYRIRGTFTVPLYFAEYLAMVLPLAVHLMSTAKTMWRSLLMFAGILALISACVLTGSRSALIGAFLTFGLYWLFDALRRRAEQPSSLLASTMLAVYPVAAGVTVALILTWNRLRVMVLGGGQHEASNNARDVQWANGIELLKRNPFGFGTGQGAEVLGYVNRGGEITIDSYFLSILLEFGVLALPIFVVMFSIPLVFAFQCVQQPVEDEEVAMIMPLGICLFNFTIIKSVLSGTVNIPLAFIMLAMVVMLSARLKALREQSAPKANTLPAVREWAAAGR